MAAPFLESNKDGLNFKFFIMLPTTVEGFFCITVDNQKKMWF